MTTLPVDDAPPRARRLERTESLPSSPPSADGDGPGDGDDARGRSPEPWYRPIRAWRHEGRRFLPGIAWPVSLFVLWRVVQLAITVQVGGKAFATAFNYDGEHYLRILHYGYWNPRPIMPPHAFFPGISWLATPIFKVTGSDFWTVHVTETITGVAAFVAIWGVTKAWKDERIARRAVLLFALFPSSLFLWAFYSEGLFIALGAGAVWADRKNRHWIAAACMLGVATTRSVGILIPVVIVLARLIRRRRPDRWVFVYSAAGAIGLGAVLLMMWHQVGDPFAFLKVQGDWGRNLSAPWVTVEQGIDNLYPKPTTVMVPALVARNFDLWAVPIVILPVVYAAFSRRDRYPMETWMLGVVMIVLPLCSSVLASFNRFVFADWVIYPVYASFFDRLPRWARWPTMIAIAISFVFVGYAMIGRFSADRFVG